MLETEDRMMDALEAIARRQGALHYRPDPVEAEKIEAVLQAAVAAPSPLNLQPWAFIVVTDPRRTASIAEYLIELQAEVVYGGLLRMSQDFTARMLRLYTQLHQAPCFIMACLEPKVRFASVEYEPILRDFYLMSLGAAMQNMMVAATALGLGTRWFTGFTLEDEGQGLKDVFGIPAGIEVAAITPLGYCEEPPKVRPEQTLASLVEFRPGNGTALARLFNGKLPLQEVVHENEW